MGPELTGVSITMSLSSAAGPATLVHSSFERAVGKSDLVILNASLGSLGIYHFHNSLYC